MRFRLSILVLGLTAALSAFDWQSAALATGVPISGFLAQVGLTLTDKFEPDSDPEFDFYIAKNELSLAGQQFGSGGTPFYDVALLDSGAGASLITTAADASYNIQGAGFRGTETLTIGGATGFLDATINDAMAMFATGLGNRTGSSPLSFSTSTPSIFKGQSSISLLTMPEETDLPNVIGVPFISQYATYIRSDQPQVFQLNGETVRSPQVQFLPLGSGGQGIIRRAPLQLNPGAAFTSPPAYVFNFANLFNGDPLTDNPSAPTVLQQSGGMYLNVNATNNGQGLGTKEFLFDTGADVTVVSTLNALLLGFDVDVDEPDFTIDVVGSGGTNLEVPGFFADQFTILATGGSVTLTNVPIIVLDVVDPADPGNVVDGIVGTNVLAGRNIVIDPKPALGGGGTGPSLYISDPVTTEKNWTTAAASATFGTGGNWNNSTSPTNLGIANVRHVSGGDQTAVVSSSIQVWEVNVSGDSGHTMTLSVSPGVTLTTFSGINIEQDGIVQLNGSMLDAQSVEIQGGELRGQGVIETGSGIVPGQVENRSGVLSPGNGVGSLTIRGRFANAHDGTLALELGGNTPGTLFDQLIVDGGVSLGGKLAVSLVDLGGGLFAPQVGNMFEIITSTDGIGGAFDQFDLPGGYQWDVIYGTNDVMLKVLGVGGLMGDYNGDGMIDAADYSAWRDAMSAASTSLLNDPTPGVVDESDFLYWRAHFGESLGSGSGASSAAVPEPASLALLLMAVALAAACGRRLRRR